MTNMPLSDEAVRLGAFNWLAEQVTIHGEVLPRTLLAKGFEAEGKRIPLLGPQGIFKPQVLREVPLSITTAPEGPYDDSFSPDGLLLYRYRGKNPEHPDNVGLRKAMQSRIPLVYFHGIIPGKYLAVWPVFIVGDSSVNLTFTVAVDDMAFIRMAPDQSPTQILISDPEAQSRRSYVTALTKRRLHQQGFRERVLEAYRQQCACCRLRHESLLDAAHIIPDSEPEGVPTVANGIALCKLHHAAFDSLIIGITPEYVIRVREDVLHEADGPMLKHGLQGLDGRMIVLPRKQGLYPNRDLLDMRFQQFRKAG
jgi:putative restriction endonuclease